MSDHAQPEYPVCNSENPDCQQQPLAAQAANSNCEKASACPYQRENQRRPSAQAAQFFSTLHAGVTLGSTRRAVRCLVLHDLAGAGRRGALQWTVERPAHGANTLPHSSINALP